MKLGWAINRLRSMGPREVLHRVAERARQRVSKRRHEGWGRYPSVELRSVFPEWPARINAASPSQREAIRSAAEAFLSGSFLALGRAWPARKRPNLFPITVWHLDPVTRSEWPRSYCHEIDFRNSNLGDIKYVWEFNRLQQLPILAAYARLEHDARALQTIDSAIASWHTANPPFKGVNWASGIEIALRAISLLATLSILPEGIETSTRRRIGEILSASAFWLARFPSRFSSANNHLVAELVGRSLISRSMRHDSSATDAELWNEIALQVLPDGIGAEQSPTYGAFTAELAVLCWEAATESGTQPPPFVADRLARFADAVAWLGSFRFGDDDEGRALTLGIESDYPASVASAILGALKRPGLANGQEDFRALLLGRPQKVNERPTGLKTFQQGGMTIWRGRIAGRDIDMSLDHGPLGYLSIAAHGHADALAVSLAIDGRPILIDPGTYLYGSGGEWRKWFRSTPAHNTLNIDGQSQSVMSGPFNWLRKANATLLEIQPEPEWAIRARHDGYESSFHAVHERTVRRTGDEILIEDRLLGEEHSGAIVFQVAAGLDVVRHENCARLVEGGVTLLTIALPDESFEICCGADGPAGGWMSPRFGELLPAGRIVWRGLVDAGGVRSRLIVGSTPSDRH